jgi:hypothetical protein
MTAELRDLTFFSDEVWFHLSGYVNSQLTTSSLDTYINLDPSVARLTHS